MCKYEPDVSSNKKIIRYFTVVMGKKFPSNCFCFVLMFLTQDTGATNMNVKCFKQRSIKGIPFAMVTEYS